MSTRYSFGYRPSSAIVPGVFHHLEIKLAPTRAAQKNRLTVHAKEGYYREKRRAGQS